MPGSPTQRRELRHNTNREHEYVANSLPYRTNTSPVTGWGPFVKPRAYLKVVGVPSIRDHLHHRVLGVLIDRVETEGLSQVLLNYLFLFEKINVCRMFHDAH